MDPIAAIILANSPPRAEHLLVIDVPELVPAAVGRADRVSVWCDDIRHARQVPSPLLLHRLDAAALSGVDLVWLRLPKALGALDEYAELVAGHACAAVRLVAGGREKHLNRTMNRVLGSHFGAVAASLGQRKSRALLASDPIPAPITWPRRRELVVAGQLVDLHWHGATFAAGRIDAGTQLLIDHLESVADADRYLDLGSGSGVLATLLARRHPQAQVHAVDASWAAVDASRLTSAGTGVEVHWACDLAGFGNGSLDVVVCNPPFHRGPAKDSTPTLQLFAEAGRALSDGGEFWCVFNSHLPWRTRLSQLVGPTRQVAQNRHYTLTRSLRR
ncbi:MAG: methyltransferase [Brooklawnia sp.]|uniref:class I SAM-dependent methyltransferase n=1 Tax=Brooklawnia sp. TaxID=2699740 RepID=UPI003C720E57